MKVKEFEIEESKVNKGLKILVAIAENGEKFVVAGDHHACTILVPYNHSWDAIGESEFKKLTGQ